MAAPLLGKTYLVTGSTDGIGAHTAQRLAAQGATVLVHGRNPARVEQAVALVRAAGAGSGAAPPAGFVADLSSLADVRGLAQRVLAAHPQIDVLLNNAGVFEERLRLSWDGLEMTWAVNVAAPFLLTSLLLGALRERVVVVSSISAASSLDWGNLQQERGFSSHDAYSLSKLAEMLFTFQLAARLQAAGSPLTCNCLDPGTVNTKMLAQGWGSIGMRLQDANYELTAATDPALAAVSGAYFVGGRQTRAPAVAYDGEAQLRLWRLLERQTGAAWSL